MYVKGLFRKKLTIKKGLKNMLNSIQNTTNYHQNSRVNFGNLSSGLTENLIRLAKSPNAPCTLQQVRDLAELATESFPFLHVVQVSVDERPAVSAYSTLTQRLAHQIRFVTGNLYDATKHLVDKISSGLKSRVMEIRDTANPPLHKSDMDLEKEIRNFAVNIEGY
jgi:hypothetical protein